VTLGVAHVGAQAIGSARFTTVPGDPTTPADDADVAIAAGLTDVRSGSPTGADYDPNTSGPDLTLIARLRITDLANGPGGTDAGTAAEVDFAVPVDCEPTTDPAKGSACDADTTADAVMPGFVKEGKNAVLQVFRVRVNDSGSNGLRGDSDDMLFQQQGIFLP
jgi:hypothetical protein